MLQSNSEFPDFDPSIAKEFENIGFSGFDIMGIPLLDGDSLLQLIIRFVFNIIVCWVIIRYFYYRISGRRVFLFTFSMFSVTVFLLIFLLDTVSLQIGMALGLFAIFGIIRYRTEQVSIREMTYLFVIIGVSVINGLAMAISIAELVVANLLFVGSVALLESRKFIKHTSTKAILYEKIDLVKADRYDDLVADLKERTGLDILRVEVGHIDFLKDTALLQVYYKPVDNLPNSINQITKLSNM